MTARLRAVPCSATERSTSMLAGRRVVVKFGGAAMEDPAALNAWAQGMAALVTAGAEAAVVHGGGPALTRMLARLGIATRFEHGHRVTSPEAAEVAEMVLSGSTHRAVTAALGRAGLDAVGLAGGDARILEVEPYRPDDTDLGRVGRIAAVRSSPIERLLASGFMPVLSSTVRDADGAPFNVNADVVAAAIATALRSDVVAFLSDVPAVRDGTGHAVEALTPTTALALVRDGVADGGMRPKLEAAAQAVASGVGSAVLADGRDAAVWLAAIAGEPVACTRVEPGPSDRAATGGP